MKLVNKLELRIDGFDKCVAIVESDCPLGSLYDYSCALKTFVVQKMQELESQEKKVEPIPEEKAG